MFKSSNINLINESRVYFNFRLPSELLIKRKDKFTEKFVANQSLLDGYMSTDTSSKQCSTRGYKWIYVAVTAILSPIQDTCRWRQVIQVDTTSIRDKCIRCKRGIT